MRNEGVPSCGRTGGRRWVGEGTLGRAGAPGGGGGGMRGGAGVRRGSWADGRREKAGGSSGSRVQPEEGVRRNGAGGHIYKRITPTPPLHHKTEQGTATSLPLKEGRRAVGGPGWERGVGGVVGGDRGNLDGGGGREEAGVAGGRCGGGGGGKQMHRWAPGGGGAEWGWGREGAGRGGGGNTAWGVGRGGRSAGYGGRLAFRGRRPFFCVWSATAASFGGGV
jgi:hypothetical protein